MILMIINIIGFRNLGYAVIDEYMLFVGINLLLWGSIVHRVYFELTEMSEILDVNIFSIKADNSKKQK